MAIKKKSAKIKNKKKKPLKTWHTIDSKNINGQAWQHVTRKEIYWIFNNNSLFILEESIVFIVIRA